MDRTLSLVLGSSVLAEGLVFVIWYMTQVGPLMFILTFIPTLLFFTLKPGAQLNPEQRSRDTA